MKNVHNCVSEGGKVLIPVFALGRAQELCILIETYWERMKLNVPVYFSAGLTERANDYYKLFISWTNQKIKKTFTDRNMFDFSHIKPFERSLADRPGPMVLFAAPGMLHSGTSLEVFKKWAGDEKNMVILPGYCVAGTVGAKILAGIRTIEFDKKNSLHVKMKVKNLSFSAHADAKGILQLIRQCEPKSVVLVHGEKGKMSILKEKIHNEFNIPCYDPANAQIIQISTDVDIPLKVQDNTIKTCLRSKNLNFPNFDAVDFEKTELIEKVKAYLYEKSSCVTSFQIAGVKIDCDLSLKDFSHQEMVRINFPKLKIDSIEDLFERIVEKDLTLSFESKLLKTSILLPNQTVLGLNSDSTLCLECSVHVNCPCNHRI